MSTGEGYERLRLVRGGHRGVVTKITTEVDTLLTGEPPTSEQISRLKIVYDQLENKMQLLQTYDGEIVKLCKTDDVALEIDESETIFAKILEYKRRIMVVVNPTPVTSAPVTTTDCPTVVAAAKSIMESLVSTGNVRLPKLVLPKFRGNVTQWSTFWVTA